MNSVNIAVLGCGYWGPNLVRNFNAVPNARVTVICDRVVERLDHLKAIYPDVATTTDFEKVLSDRSVDAVAIATPVRTHRALAQAALEEGKHTFIEKPMAASAEECAQLIRSAEKADRKLMVGHTFIFTTTVRKIKELIDSGEIGTVMYVSSRRLNLGLFQKDINVAWDLAPHDISMILHFLDEDPVSVNCQGKAHITPGIEDVTNMSLNFGNGSFAVIQSSWIDPKKIRETVIVGTKQMVVFDDTEPMEKVRIYDKRVEKPPHYDTFAEFHYSYHYGDMRSPFIKQVEPLRTECEHFVDCVANGKKPITGGYEGLRVVRILEAAQKSLRAGGVAVEVKP